MDEIALTLALGEHERGRALADGRVQPRNIKLTTFMMNDDAARHDRFLAGEFDACELSFAVYITSWQQGAELSAIPVFLNRRFRHSFIYVNTTAGIREPRDLQGKRVGIASWLNTAAVWLRGLLQHDYEVDLTTIVWVSSAPPEVPGWTPPSGIQLAARPRSALLPELLVQGEIDALIIPAIIDPIQAGDPRVARLYPNYQEVEADYYRRTGILPISHVLAVRRQLLDQHPWAAASLFEACQQAKKLAYKYAADPGHSMLLWYGALMEKERQIFGPDPWPYGIEANRQALEAFAEYAFEQGLIRRHPEIGELFHPSCRQLTAASA